MEQSVRGGAQGRGKDEYGRKERLEWRERRNTLLGEEINKVYTRKVCTYGSSGDLLNTSPFG